MRSEQAKPIGARRWVCEPTMVKPWPVWGFAAVTCAGAVASLLFAHYRQIELRYTVPVCMGLIIVTIGVVAWGFLRIQHHTLMLMQRPAFMPRLAGAMLRSGTVLPPFFVYVCLHGNRALLTQIPMLVMITFFCLGISIALAGSIRRVGTEQFCMVCGYECRTSSERCAECGNHWLKPGGLLRGRRVVQRAAIVVGGIVVLLGFVGSWPTRFSLGRLGLYLMPDSVRIRAATTGATWSSEGRLKDLLADRLSAEEEHTLATRLLDQRLEEQGLSPTAVTWLEKKVLAGALPEAIHERFFEELLELWLEGPDSVMIGESFHPLIASRNRCQALGSTLTMQIYLAGVSTDAGKSFEGRNDSILAPATASNVWYHCSRRSVVGNAAFLPRVSIDATGEHEIVVHMWLAVVARTARSFSAKWKGDGTPEPPPEALWTKELVLRRTVLVESR